MKRMLAILLCLALGISLCTGCGGESSGIAGSMKIALIAADQTDSCWDGLEAGAMKAASELGIEIISMTADTGTDPQVSDQINDAVASGCHAIVIAAFGEEDVSAALQEAVDAGVKLVYVGSAADVEAAAAIVTDHKAAGKAAAETMMDVLNEKRITNGTIGIIRADTDDDSAAQREAGFREGFADTDYRLLETQYNEASTAGIQTIAEEMISQEVVGIFCCDEDAAVGAGEAVQESGTGTVVVGFGSSDAVLNLMEDGSIRAAVEENADTMGYEGVRAAVAALNGEAPDTALDVGVTVLKSEAPVLSNSDHKIALIAVDRIDKQWIDLEEGAMKAAAELGCEVINLSPHISDDEQQIQQINDAVSSGYHAIIIAAGDPDGISPALNEAIEAGVKVICVDTPVDVKASATFSTDNRAAGRTAGETLIAALEEWEITEGSIGMISVNPDTEPAAQREAGFREAFEGKDFTLLETQYSEGDAAKSHVIAEKYIAQDVVGIFCGSEGCISGAGNAIRAKNADTLVVGFDASDVILEMIEEECILAVVAQNFGIMGYEGVKAACAALNGEKLDGAVTDTGVSVLTK